MMVRLVSCGIRQGKQAVIDRERETETSLTNKKRKEAQ
jgi:hypothetical protein